MFCDTTNPDLLRSLRDPDSEIAWQKFVALYEKPILKHCCSSGLTTEQAREVAQECFIKCFRYLPGFEYDQAVGRFRAWLNLIVNQQMVQHRRSCIREERSRAAWEQLVREFSVAADYGDGQPVPFETELVALAFERVRSQVQPRNWQLFQAFAIHGTSSERVAAQFGISLIAVRVIVHRVKARLRREWQILQNGPL